MRVQISSTVFMLEIVPTSPVVVNYSNKQGDLPTGAERSGSGTLRGFIAPRPILCRVGPSVDTGWSHYEQMPA